MANFSNLLDLSPSKISAQSAQLKPVPTTPQVKTSTVPTQQAVQGASTVNNAPTGGTNYQNGGWYNGKYYWGGQFFDNPSQVNAGSQSSTPSDSAIDFDAMYAPIFEGYNQAEASAKENAALSEANVLAQKDSQLRDLATEQQKGEQFFADATQRAQANKQSAFDQAVRNYNALQQQSRSRFGALSSAGQAVNDISNQEFIRQQGETDRSYAGIFGDIEKQHSDAIMKYGNFKMQINDKTDELLNNIKINLNNSLASINMARGQSSSEKTAKRMQTLQAVIDETRRVQQSRQQALEALDIWKAQQDYIVQNQLSSIYKQTINTMGYNPTQNYSVSPTTQGSVKQNIKYNPNLNRFEDEYGNSLT